MTRESADGCGDGRAGLGDGAQVDAEAEGGHGERMVSAVDSQTATVAGARPRGSRPAERRRARARKPRMNQGTTWFRVRRRARAVADTWGAGATGGADGEDGDEGAEHQDADEFDQRAGLDGDRRPIGAVAARTCGTA